MGREGYGIATSRKPCAYRTRKLAEPNWPKVPILSGHLPYASPYGADQNARLAADRALRLSLDPAQLPRLIVRQFTSGCQESC